MARSVSMDWPLSREEKRSCVMRLYEKDVRAADKMLRTHKAELHDLRHEVRFLRRMSHGSVSTTPAGGGSSPEREAVALQRQSWAGHTTPAGGGSSPEQEAAACSGSPGQELTSAARHLLETCRSGALPVPGDGPDAVGCPTVQQSTDMADQSDDSIEDAQTEHGLDTLKRGKEEDRAAADVSASSAPQDGDRQDGNAAPASIVKAKKHVGSASLRSQSVDGCRSTPGAFRFDGQIMKDITGGSSNACLPVEEEKDEDNKPPLTPEEATLHSALTAFYEKRKIEGKMALVERISRRYAKDGVPELWASIATKYTLPPAAAVQWVALTLGPLMPVQWPKGQVPESASRALSALAKARSSGGAEGAQELHTLRTAALQSALDAGDLDAIRALSFYGCPSSSLRPQLWRALLSRPARGNRCLSPSALEERRAAYRQLHTRALNADNSEPTTSTMIKEASLRDSLRKEVEADARACWRGEAFLQKPEVFNAVVSIAFTTAVRYSRHIRGSCDVAALLLFALSQGSSEELASAEADAFFCLTHLINELQGTISEDQNQEGRSKVRRFNWLLRTYDPALAELLATHNLTALPATRLGVAFCTRAGFSLEICVRIWDSLLADPRRFEMGDHAVLALLLLPVTRGRLLQQRHDAGNLAEALLAAPRTVDPEALLRTMFAICAFERRCGPDSQIYYPPQPGVLDVIANSALDGLSRVWGGVRARWKARGASSSYQPMVQVQAQQSKPTVVRPCEGSYSSDSSQVAALALGII
mmetsp:Transcript_49380/g.86990  ORF Transcript_49380/g.86990 Transcript_49380/m.86990 type:complete len:763 (-) Transcript_49380:65-2353(-)